MTKYIILLVVLIASGGVFLYSVQTVEAPAETPPPSLNPFGEGADVVGSLDDSPDSVENEPEHEEGDDEVPTAGGSQTGGMQTGAGSGSGETGATGAISRAELATHNKQSDCWVGYKGVVYDVTTWLSRHPGGVQAIAQYCGKAEEFAAAFGKQHGTSKDARLKKEAPAEGTLGN